MVLKRFIIFTFVVVALSFLVNCGNTKNYAQKNNSSEELDTIVIENDSLEYKVIIIGVGFNAWLATQQPRGQFTQNFMERKNIQSVIEYNIRVRNPIRYDQNLYQFQIDYDAYTDYGYEVNYLLYHYFLFFEEKYNQQLR